MRKLFTLLFAVTVFSFIVTYQSKVFAYEENLQSTPSEEILNEESLPTEEITPTGEAEQKEAQQSTPSAIIQYDLAFPGMLPDSPFYKIKVLRDKISLALTQDPMKRIDFYLRQTDKGILASAMLVDKNNIALAKETALKAEHNYTMLTYELAKLKERPQDKIFEKIKKAALKHQEVLASLAKRVKKEDQETFNTVINFSKRNIQTVESYQYKSDWNEREN